MIDNNFSLERYGLVPNGYFTANSYFQYIPCFLGMTLSVCNLKELSYEGNDNKQSILDNFMLYLPQNTDIVNICDYMYYYYGLKYMDPQKMLALKNNSLKLSEYYLIQDYEHGGMKQVPYSFINQMTIRGNAGDIYEIAIIDLVNEEQIITNKEYTIGESGVIQFYDTKIFGVIPKVLLEPPSQGYSLPTFIENNQGYNINSVFRNVGECPFEDEIIKYNNTLNRIDMVITFSEMEKEEDFIEQQEWPEIEDETEIELGPLLYDKRTFIDRPYSFEQTENE
jgi:hypothetical protein